MVQKNVFLLFNLSILSKFIGKGAVLRVTSLPNKKSQHWLLQLTKGFNFLKTLREMKLLPVKLL